MNEDILYTPDEIAQKLKITKSTVYEMIKRGDLDAHRMGSTFVYLNPNLKFIF